VTQQTLAPSPSTPAAAPRGFRPDVEGLRAIAVGTVLWYHAGLPVLNGGFAGVDIFFVISGFLITGQLVREVERDGRISLPRFYARRAKRLFPAAAVALIASAILTRLTLSRTDWETFGGDIVAAAAYFVNWRFASRAVDYLAEDVSPSPVQHFWSLAVEEQYYIVWPLLLLLLAIVIRRRGWPTRPTMGIGLALIVIPSLIWSVYLTQTNPARAYFVTTTRLWELGIGALVAIGAATWGRIPPRWAALLAWAGLALLSIGVLVQTTATPWPGSAALVPVLGAAAVIAGGFNAGPAGPVRLLGLRPMVWIGGLSYSLYLWHWPLVVAATGRWGELNNWQGAAVVTASVIPAWLTHHFVENPLRHNKAVSASTRVALSLGLVCSLLGVAAGGWLAHAGTSSGFASAKPGSSVGAEALGNGADPATALKIDMHPTSMTPDPLKATADVPKLYADGCQVAQPSVEVLSCDYGDTKSKKIIALVGDSKMVQWLPAVDAMAKDNGWRIRTYAKSSCPWNPNPIRHKNAAYTACVTWGQKVLTLLTGKQKPMLVLTSGIRSAAYDVKTGEEEQSLMVDGYVDYWSALAKAKVPVVAIADTPQPGKIVYECVLNHHDDLMTACKGDWNRGTGTAALEAAVKQVPTARFVDLNPWICPAEQCWPVIGGVLVYRQGSHITATYAASLAPEFARQVVPLVKELTRG
jgi:peptidoglycan/LPS O-acetylase OafA/YrhL